MLNKWLMQSFRCLSLKTFPPFSLHQSRTEVNNYLNCIVQQQKKAWSHSTQSEENIQAEKNLHHFWYRFWFSDSLSPSVPWFSVLIKLYHSWLIDWLKTLKWGFVTRNRVLNESGSNETTECDWDRKSSVIFHEIGHWNGVKYRVVFLFS